MPQAAPDLSQSDLVLSRYRPLRPLGSGGTGSVWLARDERNGLDVALKIVPREGKAASRAEREAVAAARLRHPRCLRAYGAGHDTGHVYIAYEYAPGRTLRDALRAGELNDAAAIEASAQVLDGLAHAHAHGIVHRDVKPANVLLVDGEAIDARLLDFGLAQMSDGDTLTAVGDVPGTLAYIAPERLAGREASAASDVWSTGVVLWESLAGWHPFWRASPIETARAIEAGAPPLTTARPDLPKALTTAVDRALSVDPAVRPTAARLAQALRGARPQRKTRSAPVTMPAVRAARLPHAALAATLTAWTTSTLPFFPGAFLLALALFTAAVALARPRIGAALALAAPILPLGNVALGLALVYALAAAAVLAVSWREPRSTLVFVVGPLLGPLAALGLLPLAAAWIRSPLRRALQTGIGVVAAAAVAGIRGVPAPLAEAPLPAVDLAAIESPVLVAAELAGALAARPGVLLLALALGLGAAALPFAARRGAWGIAALGAALLAATLLPAAGLAAAPLVITTWLTCLVLGARTAR